jgi:hypothetical protein
MKFPKPWTVEQTESDGCVVLDANGRKLFYILGDEGDGDEGGDYYVEPSVLFWGDKEDSASLLAEIRHRLEGQA